MDFIDYIECFLVLLGGDVFHVFACPPDWHQVVIDGTARMILSANAAA